MSSCLHCKKPFDQSKSPYIGLGPKCGAKVPGVRPANLVLKDYSQSQLDNLVLSDEEEFWVSGEYKKDWNKVEKNAELIFKLSKADINNQPMIYRCAKEITDPKELAQLGKMVLQDQNINSETLDTLTYCGIVEAYQHPNFDFKARRLHLERNTRVNGNNYATALAIYRNPNLTPVVFKDIHQWLTNNDMSGEQMNAQMICDENIPIKNRVLLIEHANSSYFNTDIVNSIHNSKDSATLVPEFYKLMDYEVKLVEDNDKGLAHNYTNQLRLEKDQLRDYTDQLHRAEKLKKSKKEIAVIKKEVLFCQSMVDTMELVISKHPNLSKEIKDLADWLE
ncbi:MAG: hypothetical protein KF802_02345 [Bdellovibrionaceae bacterium]|nr:hypothetical protein [Pseudobdellovibrionaceae bacterium]